jgi:AcrR family transcriptional regulator
MDKRVVRTGNALFNAISRLLESKKFEDINIKEVSELAGIGRATFYRNFDYVEDVLKLKVDHHFNELTTKVEPFTTDDAEPVDLQPMFAYWVSNAEILKVLIKADRWEIFATRFSDASNIPTSELSEKAGFNSAQTEYLQAIIQGMFNSILHTWVSRGCIENAEELKGMFEIPFRMYLIRQKKFGNSLDDIVQWSLGDSKSHI